MGRAVPDGRPQLARELGEPDAVLRLSAGAAEGHLHDERDRVDQLAAAEGGEEEGGLPDPRIGPQGHVAGDDAGLESLEPACEGLGESLEPLGRGLRRPRAGMIPGPVTQNCLQSHAIVRPSGRQGRYGVHSEQELGWSVVWMALLSTQPGQVLAISHGRVVGSAVNGPGNSRRVNRAGR